MHYSGIISYSGLALGQSSLLANSSRSEVLRTRATDLALVDQVGAESKRRVHRSQIEATPSTIAAESFNLVPQETPGRAALTFQHGTSLPYLAQHIAQEVVPDPEALDRHALASRAYVDARESTVQVLSQGSGLDIHI